MAVSPRIHGRLAAVVLAALALGAPAQAATRTGDRQARATAAATALVGAINQVRVAHGLHPLRSSTQLAAAATGHDREMGARGYFAHTAANGATLMARVPGRWSSLGENLVWSTPGATPAQLVATWMASPLHRANLLSPAWSRIGLDAETFAHAPGYYAGRTVEIVTADFGS